MTVFKSSFALLDQFSATQSIGSLLFTATLKFLQQLQLVAVCSAGQELSRRFFPLPLSLRDCNEGERTCLFCASVALLYASSRDKRLEVR